jgi:hypothetical protein
MELPFTWHNHLFWIVLIAIFLVIALVPLLEEAKGEQFSQPIIQPLEAALVVNLFRTRLGREVL